MKPKLYNCALCIAPLPRARAAVEDWAEGFKHFVATGVFNGHKLVGVGHSLGATMAYVLRAPFSERASLTLLPPAYRLLTAMPGALPPVSYHALVLVEPALITPAAWDAHREQQERA